ncbi:MAG: SDR family NAD(P)-dependent oxidoreductase [Bacteroidales bacterium]|nr:SDR family NAD(P)-dependent oxidoreductase [Bacteroidales bacterium]
MKSALIVGGSNGIGLSVALQLCHQREFVYIVDRVSPKIEVPSNIIFLQENLLLTDFQWLDNLAGIDTLFYSAGFGRVSPFETLECKEIDNCFTVNTISAFKIIKHFMPQLKAAEPFYCGIMVSIAARIASPLFSIYSATKAALFRGIEAINSELRMSGSQNRILEISPGSIKGTSFNGGATDLNQTKNLAKGIIDSMKSHNTLLIPEYDAIFKDVIRRYNESPELFADESYLYKINGNRLQKKKQLKVGYLSGTFDLFHIGHLNLLRKAREYCDFLVVGVHKDASHKGKTTFIPFDERKSIVASVKYVDKVIESEKEDVDIYKKGIVKYDYLFVGSDYKGSERFNKYEDYFSDKDVKIIYFPYTKGTSSTQLRSAIDNTPHNKPTNKG